MIFVTSNPNKLKEMQSLLGFTLPSAKIDLDEIQSVSVEQIAKHKALQAYAKLHTPVIVEDTGLYIEGLNGFPGALIRWTIEGLGYEKMCRLVDLCTSRNAYAQTCIAFYDGKRLKTFIGKVDGKISMHMQGGNAFGWDYIFIPKGYSKTFAQMSLEEKNKMSHRGKAVKKLALFLKHNKIR